MKKSVITGVALSAFALTAGFTTQPANASAAYRTLKTKSYANTTPAYHAKSATKSVYLWNSTLTKKQHNLKNYPKTTWYVQKSVKLTNGKKTGIFYYVKNKSKSANGYVWRSYLTKGAFKATTITNTTTTSTTSSTTAQTADSQNQDILSLFTGTVENPKLMSIASQLANFKFEELDEYRAFADRLYSSELTPNQIANMKVISGNATENSSLLKELTSGKITYKEFVKEDLSDTTALVTNPQDYNGWSIGVGSVTKNDIGGNYHIILIPAGTN